MAEKPVTRDNIVLSVPIGALIASQTSGCILANKFGYSVWVKSITMYTEAADASADDEVDFKVCTAGQDPDTSGTAVNAATYELGSAFATSGNLKTGIAVGLTTTIANREIADGESIHWVSGQALGGFHTATVELVKSPEQLAPVA